MRLGITDMIGLAASLVFALPLANYAVIRLLAGDLAVAVALLSVAVGMVVLPHYFLDPARIARRLLSGLLPRQLRGDSADETGGSAGADNGETAGESEPTDPAAVDGNDAANR